MAIPTCGNCGGTTFSASSRTYVGVPLVLIYCTARGAVTGAVNKPPHASDD